MATLKDYLISGKFNGEVSINGMKMTLKDMLISAKLNGGGGGEVDYNDESLWAVGGINPNGSNSNSTSRLRTITYIPAEVKRVTVDAGYSYILVCYDDDGNVPTGGGAFYGYYDPINKEMTNQGKYYTGEIVLADIASVIGDHHNIRVLVRNENAPSSPLTTADGLKIHLFG